MKTLTKRELRYFNVAKSISKTSDFHGHHLGCVVAIKNNILSVASNSEKTHSTQGIYNRFRDFNIHKYPNKLHAEVHALSWLIGKDIDWSRVEVYVYREYKSGIPAVSKPCPACMSLIKDLGIKKLYYLNEQGEYTCDKL